MPACARTHTPGHVCTASKVACCACCACCALLGQTLTAAPTRVVQLHLHLLVRQPLLHALGLRQGAGGGQVPVNRKAGGKQQLADMPQAPGSR